MDQTKIEICSDCAMLIANGTVGNEDRDEDTAHAAKIDAIWQGYHLAVGDGEAYFSYDNCDGCGSTLGGDRMDAVAWPVAE